MREPRRRNYYRADLGQAVIDTYFKKTKDDGDDFLEVVTDMITDVLHAVHQHGFDSPADIIPEAIANFERER